MANFIIGIFNLIIKSFALIAKTIISILPTSPFLILENIDIPFLAELNFIIPIDILIGILSYWLGAIATYDLVSVIMRWVKVIS